MICACARVDFGSGEMLANANCSGTCIGGVRVVGEDPATAEPALEVATEGLYGSVTRVEPKIEFLFPAAAIKSPFVLALVAWVGVAVARPTGFVVGAELALAGTIHASLVRTNGWLLWSVVLGITAVVHVPTLAAREV